MAIKTQKLGILDTIFVGALLAIFGGIVLHAPISVGFGTLFPAAEVLIKSWKEILLVLASLLLIVILTRQKCWNILKSPLIVLIGLYGLLHIALIPLFYAGLTATIAGLLIDLRYLLFFVLVFVAIRLYPNLRRPFIITFIVGALIVTVFALLQVTVLPVDVLKYLGYNTSTIVPYLTVDQNMDYIRINSTLRGPNPLGAYAVIVLAVLAAFWLKGKYKKFTHPVPLALVLGMGAAAALWASYSRSALVAGVVALGIVFLLTVGRKLSRPIWVGIIVAIFAFGGAFIAARDTEFVSNIILHENINEGGEVNSNDGHFESLADGFDRMVHQPFGGGIGSTGSASLYSDNPLIIENQYLFIAHEAGWIGLALFLYISLVILRKLWHKRTDWLALGVLASGISMALIGLLLPVWVDDTVAIIWWGLAAIVIGGSNGRAIIKTSKRTA